MTRKFHFTLWLSLSFLSVAMILYFLDLKINANANQVSYIPYESWSFVTICTLYGFTLFIFFSMANSYNKERLQLEQTLHSTTESLTYVQSSLDDAVEKKTFEMSVINGSLNREIAERIQAEAEGLKLRKRLQAILNSAGDGIVGLDIHGKVTFVNQKATELLGWSAEELIGNIHHDMVHHSHEDGTDFPAQECPIHKAFKDGMDYSESDDIFWKKSGQSFSVEYTSTPLLNDDKVTGAVVVFKDIGKTKKLKKQLELIVNSAGEGIFGLDIDGKVTFMNKAATIMLGWEQEELIGRSHHDLVHHSHINGTHYKEEDCPIYMACQDGKVHFKSDDIFWAKDGNSFTVEYTSTPIIEGRKLTGAVVVFRDLTTFS
ncbi:MAG: PAS domain-containing protein [Proteobacteria bacterium]|nr:PAS domain-containing protein [Pseudomonadota bacterium]MBU1059968.1 PAS domain-containing protein [Pseudomonadota bacterium]